MESTADRLASDRPGLRARRRAQTLDEIHWAAVELSDQHGFDNITVDDIAARAGVAARTFFRYFPTKESAVVYDRWGIATAIESRFTTADPPTMRLADIEAAVAEVIDTVIENDSGPAGAAEDVLLTYRVITTTPQLRAAAFAEHSARVGAVVESVADPAERSRTRLVLAVTYAVVGAAVNEWVDSHAAGHTDASLLAIYQKLCTQLRTISTQ
ncbi:TetR family transcriptional regulator [Nocardia transvalensis]|uniref:TetR family transcriptional regulator n=1 Tax=Nocardia transvalensis TaxID=37333 RepID=UPI0018942EB3|nr:TetR family transcriptional regulator [Nocardia transvalensis]MBF6332213.1 TetR family transcriptional regulator [Nocardia transvalensis]